MRTNPNLSLILDRARNACRCDEARDRLDEIRIADEYGEPGYSKDSELPIVIGNWNSITRWQDGQSVTIDDAPERLGNILEALGFTLEWCDEWVEACEYQDGQPVTACYRCQPDGYGWTASYLEIDGEIVGSTEILESPEIEIEHCLGDPDRAVKIIGAEELEEAGFVRFPEEFANGFYGGQDSDPHKIADSLADIGIERFVFTIDDVGQFDCHFTLTVEDSKAPGSRFAPRTGRRIAAACWHVHGLFFTALPADAQRVLVACEFSGVVRDAFRARGHDAVSCDIIDTDRPDGDHIKGDVLEVLDRDWDLVLAFPPCTYLCASGGGSWRCNPEHDPEGERRAKRREAVAFFCEFLNSRCERVAIENPKSVLPKFVDSVDGRWVPRDDYAAEPRCRATQMIQPWQFGHPESKETFLWLKNLPKLEPTNVLDIKASGYFHKGERKWRWQNQTGKGYNKLGQSPDRWKLRSTTYEGVGQAMAEQWG